MKILKLFISLSLILSVSLINSLAAISVSDGSAFVTKAEFAADLNNLSNRMSTLENSLDAKIDSLVSSYLSRNGIWNGEKQTTNDERMWDIKPLDITISSNSGSISKSILDKPIIQKNSKSGLLTGFLYFTDADRDNLNKPTSRWGYFFMMIYEGNWFSDCGMFISINISETLDGANKSIEKFSSIITSQIAQSRSYNEKVGAWCGFALPSNEILIPVSFFVSKDSKLDLTVYEDAHFSNVSDFTVNDRKIRVGFKDEFQIY